MGTVRVGAPMERIALDIMGPLNETEHHNRYVLVIKDYFIRWVEAFPLPNDQSDGRKTEKILATAAEHCHS